MAKHLIQFENVTVRNQSQSPCSELLCFIDIPLVAESVRSTKPWGWKCLNPVKAQDQRPSFTHLSCCA